MARRLLSAFLCFVFFCSVGGHFAILQSVAWTKMIRTYSRSVSLPVAAAKTFDGRHPCEACNRIAHAQSRETATAVELPLLKVESLLPARLALPDLVAYAESPSLDLPAGSLGAARPRPPTPPPRYPPG
jgi:hypothetical protein